MKSFKDIKNWQPINKSKFTICFPTRKKSIRQVYIV
jgi:hypothetical protein